MRMSYKGKKHSKDWTPTLGKVSTFAALVATIQEKEPLGIGDGERTQFRTRRINEELNKYKPQHVRQTIKTKPESKVRKVRNK